MNYKLKYLTMFLVILISLLTICDCQLIRGLDSQYLSDRYIDPRSNAPDLVHRPDKHRVQSVQSVQQQNPQLGPSARQDLRFEPRASEFISQSVMRLGYNIGRELSKHRLSGAHIFSPVCIGSAMSLLLLGANGKTFQELMQLFGYDRNTYFSQYPYKIHEEFGFLVEDTIADGPNPYRYRADVPWKLTERKNNDGGIRGGESNDISGPISDYHKIHIANGIFVQDGYTLRPDFIGAVQGAYKSVIKSLDFQNHGNDAKNTINDWVNRHTYGKIPTIISEELRPDTNVIIGSALYFKALWDTKFLDAASVDADFYPDGPKAPSIKVTMMANGGIFPFYEGKDCNCKLIGLPYKGNLSTMYIFQPYESTRQKLREFQEFLTPARIEEYISKMTKKTAVLAFPKLHIKNSFNLRKLFTDMGAGSLFSARGSDLSLISDGQINNYAQQISGVSRPVRPPVLQEQNTNKNRQPPSLNDRLTFANRFDGTHSGTTQDTNNTDQQDTTEYLTTPNYSEFLNNENLTSPVYVEQTTTLENLETTTSPTSSRRYKRGISYKVESNSKNQQPLRFKDLIINKRTTKLNPEKKILRKKRQTNIENNYNPSDSLKNLDRLRNSQNLVRPQLFVEDVIHKVDLVVNEQGTEGGAATITYLRRSGTDAVMRADTPFLILIRHDTTKLPLFYGPVYEPSD